MDHLELKNDSCLTCDNITTEPTMLKHIDVLLNDLDTRGGVLYCVQLGFRDKCEEEMTQNILRQLIMQNYQYL